MLARCWDKMQGQGEGACCLLGKHIVWPGNEPPELGRLPYSLAQAVSTRLRRIADLLKELDGLRLSCGSLSEVSCSEGAVRLAFVNLHTGTAAPPCSSAQLCSPHYMHASLLGTENVQGAVLAARWPGNSLLVAVTSFGMWVVQRSSSLWHSASPATTPWVRCPTS